MTEHCPDHHELVKEVGKISGNVELILSMQREIKNDVSELFTKYNFTNIESVVQKTKLAPILWALIVVGGYLLVDWAKEFFKR